MRQSISSLLLLRLKRILEDDFIKQFDHPIDEEGDLPKDKAGMLHFIFERDNTDLIVNWYLYWRKRCH